MGIAMGDLTDGNDGFIDYPVDRGLYVDLDGTLYPGDTLWDSLAILAHRSPAQFMRSLTKIANPAVLKEWLADRCAPDAAVLPYRIGLVQLCKRERSRGRRVVLATAAHATIANAVASHLGCFDGVIATKDTNCKGRAKLSAIRADSKNAGFVYAGDSAADTVVWSSADGAVLAGRAASWRSPRFDAQVLARFPNPIGIGQSLLKALRPHQWAKNLLVFVPLLAAHRFLDAAALKNTILCFAAFCLCASAAYLLNDVLDIENDRSHVRKKNRPVAAGTLPVWAAVAVIPALLITAVVLGAVVSVGTAVTLLGYFSATFFYSTVLKRLPLVDVFTLALLYTLRCVAGHVATGIPSSPWLLGFTIFLFLSLAFAKRYSELLAVKSAGAYKAKGRGYTADELPAVGVFGITAGFLSALILGLYVTSDSVTHLYQTPMLLWALCPVLLYWISYVWLVAWRGELQDDPLVFALTDRQSHLVGLVSILFFAAACGLRLS